MDQLSVFYKFIGENKIDINEVMRINNERVAREQRDEDQRVAAADAKRKQQIARLEKERSIAIENERQKWSGPSMAAVGDFYTQLRTSSNLPNLSPLSDSGAGDAGGADDGEIPNVFMQNVGEEEKVEVVGEAATRIAGTNGDDDDGDILDNLDFIFPTVNESRTTQTAAVRPQGKNIDILKQAYNELDFNRLEEHVDKRNYRRTLCFKKKDILTDTYAILNRYDRDVVVTAENKFKELKYVYNEKQKKIKKLVKIKDKLATLEMIAARYVLPDKTTKKSKI